MRRFAPGHPDEREHALDVRPVLLPHLRELLFAIVRLIWQTEATLHHKHDVALGVARVIVDTHAEESAKPSALQLTHQSDQLGDRANSEHPFEVCRDGCCPECVGAIHIHETRIECRNLCRLSVNVTRHRARRSPRHAGDDLTHGLLGILGQHRERAIPRLVGRNLGARDPPPIHVAKQVVLWPHRSIELSEVNA